MRLAVGPDPAWLSRVRGCVVVNTEPPALVTGWMGDTWADAWPSSARNFTCCYLSPFGLSFDPKSLSLTLQLAFVLIMLPGTGEGTTVTSLT